MTRRPTNAGSSTYTRERLEPHIYARISDPVSQDPDLNLNNVPSIQKPDPTKYLDPKLWILNKVVQSTADMF